MKHNRLGHSCFGLLMEKLES